MKFLKPVAFYFIFYLNVQGQQHGNPNLPQNGQIAPTQQNVSPLTSTTPRTRKTRPKPITNTLIHPQLETRSVQTYPPPNTTTTVLPYDRPALRANTEEKPYEMRRECKDFRLSTMPVECCHLPKLITPQKIIDNCNATCFSKKDSKHCCKTNCKMAELGIYKQETFYYVALLKAHEASLIGPLQQIKFKWTSVIQDSFNYCMKDQDTKDTTTPSPTTTTDRLSQLIQNAIEQGQGQTVAPPPKTTTPTTTAFTGSTHASVPTRRNALRYCHVPVYIYKIIACMRARNFINCPNFNNQKDECLKKKDMMISCGNELNYNY
ncbi:hypothetical protein PVAND_014529 [Polypedilum vanderplanki]|uniref:Uncharacterized protein n=1 Tax=Polypedilum vanderplanki TaxID=319348 RepID=A0A9J6B9F8_POLVA|nr:hypothetical protein PVAND_014529 [Polypedilum vanderplanki]